MPKDVANGLLHDAKHRRNQGVLYFTNGTTILRYASFAATNFMKLPKVHRPKLNQLTHYGKNA